MTGRGLALTGLSLAGAAALTAAVVSVGPESAAAVRSSIVPTTLVSRGALDVVIHLNGQLAATRQLAVQAPSVGSTLYILETRQTGETVLEGDVLMVFDPTELQFQLEQALSQVAEAEQEIIKRQADADVQAAEDQVALLTARFNVRRAELDAAVDRDLIAANDYRIRQVSLEEARQALARVERDVASRAETSRAALTVLEERRAKAETDAERARQNLDRLVIRASMDGVVSIRENTAAAGGIIFGGMSLPPYGVGDAVNSGRPVVDLYDVSRMEIRAQVNEQERTNLEVGQRASVEPYALPGTPFDATITAIAGVGRAVRTAGPLRQFEVTLALDDSSALLPPGSSVLVTVDGPTIDDVLIVPRQTVFDRDGRPTVYLETADGFEPTEIEILHRSESRVAIDGIAEGARVALVDPAQAVTTGSETSGAMPGGRRP